jgi:peptidoglycan/LPS O-acetylase OafA/YrhL
MVRDVPSGGAFVKGSTSVLGSLWVAVPWFFVISGYCITATIDSTRRKPHAPWAYFRKRFRRIFPPYWVVLCATLVACGIASRFDLTWLFANQDRVYLDPSGFSAWQWVGNVSLTETWRPFRPDSSAQLLVGQAWSLCYEEQFYVVSGLVLFLAPRRLLLGFAVVTAFTLMMMGLRAARVVPPLTGWFFDGRWLLFLVGVLLYFSLNRASPAFRRATGLVLAVGSIVVLLPISRMVLKGLAPELSASAGFGALLLALNPWDERISEMRLLRPLFWSGEMCYSIYLVHILVTSPVSQGFDRLGVRGFWPTVLVTVPVSAFLSLALARLFYVGVERHFLNSGACGTRVDVEAVSVWGRA